MKKPELKYHIDKCVNMNDIGIILKKKYDINIRAYKGIDFYDFMRKKLIDNVIFPKFQFKDIENNKDSRYEDFIDYESVIEIPKYYDSSNDDEDSKSKKVSFLKEMGQYYMMSNPDASDEQLIKHLSECEKYTNFGTENYEKVNEILEVIYEEYSQYFKDGKLRVWQPREEYEWDGKKEFDYPQVIKSYKLSELIEYFDSKYGFDASDLYDWLLDYNFVEGRYWERIWSFHYDEKSEDFIRKNFRGNKAPDSLEHIINILQKEFHNEDEEELNIFIDFYKEYDYPV